MRILLSSVALFIFTNLLFAQDYNIYQQDFIQLADIVQTSFPVNDSLSKEMQSLNIEYVKKLDSCKNTDEFMIVGQTYLALLHDGHSKLKSYFLPFTRNGRYFVRFKNIDGDLFIYNYSKEIPDNYIGSKVISINGIPIDTITKRARKYISFDNDAGFYTENQYNLEWVSFLYSCGVDINTKFSIGIKEKDGISNLIFERSFKPPVYKVKVGDKTIMLNYKKMKYHENKKNKQTSWSGDLFRYTILKESNICYLQYEECVDVQYINANPGLMKPIPDWLLKVFWHFRGGNFSKFLKKMFKDIDKNNINNLIIDLRQNKGGTDILGYQLMDYLTDIENIKDYSELVVVSKLLKDNYPEYFNKLVMDYNIDTSNQKLPILKYSKSLPQNKNEIKKVLRDPKSPYFQEKPKQKFQGNIYALVGNDTFSSAGDLAVLLSDNNLAKLVGNKMGYSATANGEVLSFKLKNTGVRGTISCKRFFRPDSSKSKELKIDLKTTNSALDLFNGVDVEFNYLLNKINKH